ncbi:head GIN domain-containing protein [Paraflavisolibacter sp. H34]|uniref:head GIN domain-containing protein n=1 Tax=Huijunlia imazamoxiresistens TaxID=3127457 RepID=UPI003019640B
MLLVVALAACRGRNGKRITGNGVRGTEERVVEGFQSVTVQGSLDVVVAPGDGYRIKLEGDENLLSYVQADLHGDRLEVRPRPGYSLRPDNKVKIYATAPAFRELQINGSGNIRSAGRITAADRLKVSIHGSGDVRLEVDAPEVETSIAGSGSVKINGTTRSFSASIAGSGEVYGFNLLSEYTKVKISGSGNAEVFASKQLDIAINGAGDVAYKGTAAVSQKIHGAGNVRKRE